MPLQWTISEPQRLVTILAEGFLRIEEVEECYDAMVVADALAYMRLFDCRKLDEQHASDEDFMRFGARMSAYTANFKFGPIAFVVESQGVRDIVSRCLNLAPAGRPMKMFKSMEQAMVWLQSQPAVLA